MTGTIDDAPQIESIYDYPKYYDLLFGSDWKAEFAYLNTCADRYASCETSRVFEPACGTGRLLNRFAQAGHRVAGNDLNAAAIDYCNDRLERGGHGRPCVVGDMADFDLAAISDGKPVGLSFNTINSFRHLRGESLAQSHLECMASITQPGGLYVLGLHLLPTEGNRSMEEAWTARRGHLQVNSYMWSKAIEGRDEVLGMTLDIYTPTSHRRIEDEMRYFTYTAAQFESLLARCPQWEVAAVHDFGYEVDDSVEIDETTEDVVFVLRRT